MKYAFLLLLFVGCEDQKDCAIGRRFEELACRSSGKDFPCVLSEEEIRKYLANNCNPGGI